MEFNNGNSSLASTSSSLQTQNEIGCGDVKFGENSEITNRCYSSSENVASSSFGDNYGNIPTNSDEKDSLLQTTKLFLGGEWIEIPNALINDEFTFRSAINKESFQSLSQAAKNHLNRYLPESDGACLDEVLSCTFSTDKNFFFGNPMEKFFKKISDGYFSSFDQVQLRDHKRVLYDHYIRHYHMNLLKNLLVSRHALLETTSKQKAILVEHSRDSLTSVSSSIKHLLGELKPQSSNTKLKTNKLNYSKRRLAKHSNVRRRAKIRARLMIDDCRVKSGQTPGLSSDESAQEECSIQPLPQNSRSTMYTEKFPVDLDLYQPIKLRDVADLYREYRYLREVEPDCPSLDISDITLEEVYERTGISFQTERNFFKLAEQNFAQFAKQKYPQKQQTQEQQQHFCNGGSITTQNEIKREVASPLIQN
uniref:Uncharacterized protein n=1 Tax=Meloidogyne incognita TaxID=6306 RepID=A0A914NFK1_MELIC